LLTDFFKSFIYFLIIYKRPNPYWNFNFLLEIEKKHNIKSVFYFLEKETKNKDSRYLFDNKRIKNIIKTLQYAGCEVSIHGTYNSAEHFESMQKTINNLSNITHSPIIGNRQHCLRYFLPKTTLIHEKCNLFYDSSLGFAEHEGYRNSCCTPFKLYDFENEKMINVWQIPLIAMDITLLFYRKLSFDDIFKITKSFINETKRFSGVYTLLWHNSCLDENEIKGIKAFYTKYIELIMSSNIQATTAELYLKKMQSHF
jgi:hypothetical protein